MQISVENTGALRRRMTVAVPADRFELAFTSRLARLSRQVKIPGFRPGKTPLKVIEARYRDLVIEEVAGELIETSFREAIGQEGLKPVSGPVIERAPVERGKDLAYTAEFEVYPEIARLDLVGVAIERPASAISEEDVDRSVESLRRQRVSWRPVERAARDADRLTVDFTTKVDGKPIEGGDVQNYQLQLGSGGLIEGFEAGLNGAETGELRTLSVTLPQSYAQAEFAGKAAVFEVSVREVAEPVLPEVNEEFVRQFGIADGGVQRLRSQVRANLEREMAQRLRALARTRVLEALVDANSFELPQTLLKAETEYVRRMHRALRAQGGADRKETREESIAYEQAAQRRLARSLVLAEVIRSKGIKADPQKVRTRVIELAQGYESPEEFVRACYATPARLAEVEAALLEEQAIDQLLETAQVSEKPLTFQELVKAAAG